MNHLSIASLLVWFASAGPAFALDSSENLVNLNYYPHPGKLTVAPRYEMPFHSHQDASTNGVPTSSTSSTYEQADLSLAYGLLLPGLRLAGSETWLIHRVNNVVNSTSGKTVTTMTSGLSDPTFTLTYRLFDHAGNDGFSGDIGVSSSPSLVDHRVTNGTEEGNNGKGYGTVELSAGLYHAHAWNEAELSAFVTRDFAGTGIQDTGTLISESYTRSSDWNAGFDLYDRVHPCDRLYVQAEGDFTIPYSYTQVNVSTPTVTHTYQIPFYVVPRLDIGYLVTPWMLVDTALSYTLYTENETQAPAFPSATANSAVTWWLRARMEF